MPSMSTDMKIFIAVFLSRRTSPARTSTGRDLDLHTHFARAGLRQGLLICVEGMTVRDDGLGVYAPFPKQLERWIEFNAEPE